MEPKQVPKKKPRIICNTGDTEYEVVKSVAEKSMGWQLNNDFTSDEFDIEWTDNSVSPDKLMKMRPYQKINHFPGMYGICKKNYLAWNLNRMLKMFPNDFNFFPKTWVLPGDWIDFKNNFHKNKTFILKPEASCQGKGIFLVKKIEDVDPTGRYVAQEYLKNPYLIEGFKFDLRIYVLVTGCCPLRVYVHENGLARLATETFVPPLSENLNDMCMHLTNYAINKNNSKFIFNEDSAADDVGHKRSLASIYKLLETEGHDIEKLKKDIECIIMKTLSSVQPYLTHLYKSCQPDEFSNSMCFEVLGFDVILDSNLRPWVLEVNHTPSFTTDSPLDWKIKKGLIKDTMRILGVKAKTRKKYFADKKKEIMKRALTGKNCKESKEEKIELMKSGQSIRDKWENSHLGSFKRLCTEDYEKFLNGANLIYTELTGTNICRIKKPVDKLEPSQHLIAKTARKPISAIQNPEKLPLNTSRNLTQSPYKSRALASTQDSTHWPKPPDKKSTLSHIQDQISELKKCIKNKSVEIPLLYLDHYKPLPAKIDYSYLPGNYLHPKTFEFIPKTRLPATIFKLNKKAPKIRHAFTSVFN